MKIVYACDVYTCVFSERAPFRIRLSLIVMETIPAVPKVQDSAGESAEVASDVRTAQPVQCVVEPQDVAEPEDKEGEQAQIEKGEEGEQAQRNELVQDEHLGEATQAQDTPSEEPAAKRPRCAKAGMPEPPHVKCKEELQLPALPDGVSKALKGVDLNVMSTNEKKALRGRFYRSLEQSAVRTNKADKCPPSLAMKIKTDPRGMAAWFSIFLEEDQAWNRVELRLRQIQRNTKTTGGKRQWLTWDRMLKLFHSPTVCEAMKTFCKANPALWRPNKNAPNCVEAIEYKIDIEDTEDEVTPHIKSITHYMKHQKIMFTSVFLLLGGY